MRVHNESGVKALYVSERTSHFNGMSRAESAPIIQYLCDFDPTARRRMLRATVQGEKTGEVLPPPES